MSESFTREDVRRLEDVAVALRILADRSREPSDAEVYRGDAAFIDALRARIDAELPANTTREVRPGQIWQDCDARMSGRMVRVERVDETYAYCTPTTRYAPRKAIRLLLRRMKPGSTGWKLISHTTNQESAA